MFHRRTCVEDTLRIFTGVPVRPWYLPIRSVRWPRVWMVAVAMEKERFCGLTLGESLTIVLTDDL